MHTHPSGYQDVVVPPEPPPPDALGVDAQSEEEGGDARQEPDRQVELGAVVLGRLGSVVHRVPAAGRAARGARENPDRPAEAESSAWRMLSSSL